MYPKNFQVFFDGQNLFSNSNQKFFFWSQFKPIQLDFKRFNGRFFFTTSLNNINYILDKIVQDCFLIEYSIPQTFQLNISNIFDFTGLDNLIKVFEVLLEEKISCLGVILRQKVLIQIQRHFKQYMRKALLNIYINLNINPSKLLILLINQNSKMYRLILRMFNTQLVFYGKEKYNVQCLSAYCDVVNYHDLEDRLIVQVKNLKIRYSELSTKLNKDYIQNPQP